MPRPILRSLIAEYLARSNSSGAFSIKNVKTLSKNLTTSGMNCLLPLHSSNFSKFKLERQHTAVRSSFVGKVISLHKLE